MLLLLLASLSLCCNSLDAATTTTKRTKPFTLRDAYNLTAVQALVSDTIHPPPSSDRPEVFKCRAVSHGRAFSFAHEWTHFSASTNCNLILLHGKYTQEQWSDVVQQAYHIQSHQEHIPNPEDHLIHDVNHKLAILRVLYQRYLAPHAKHLKHQETEKWNVVKSNLQSVGCPLFKDVDLPDVMHPNWWSDVGLSANHIFKNSDGANAKPSGAVLTDVAQDTLFSGAEGVLGWDTYRWYKSDISCTPMIRLAPVEGHNQKKIEFVSAVDARLAVQTIWFQWCGANPDVVGDVGYCSGQKLDLSGIESEKKRRLSHAGFTYNVIGGGVSLGQKTLDDVKSMGFMAETAIKIIRKIGLNKLRNEDALLGGANGMMNFFKSKAKVGRCNWNAQHENKYTQNENSYQMEELPFDKPDGQRVQCLKEEDGSTAKFRLRNLQTFESVDAANEPAPLTRQEEYEEDHENEMVRDSLDAIAGEGGRRRRRRRRRLLVHGNTMDEIPAWWSENPFDQTSTYGTLTGDAKTPVDEQTVVGTPPFGWNRQNCMLCWSGPVFVANLVRRCSSGGDAVEVIYVAKEKDVEYWSKHLTPHVFTQQHLHTSAGDTGSADAAPVRKKYHDLSKEERLEFFKLELWKDE